MIALFVFSFILLFLLLPHKRDLRLKACISTIFLFFSISHFSSKKSLSSFPENTLKNISTSEFFTYESIKASNFASMVCFNRELNLFCFSNLRYRNNKTYFRWLLFFLGILVLMQDLLMFLNSIAMISGLFLRREVFILCISTSENFSGFKSNILKFIPSSNSVYNCHNPRGICLITRLTLGLSHLREYKFIHGFQDTLNPLCSCGNPVESTNISSSTVPNLSMKQALS